MIRPDHLSAPGEGNAPSAHSRQTGPAHDHVVHFYEKKETLYRTAGAFIADGLFEREPCFVIASTEHCEAIRFQMASLGLDVHAAVRSRDLYFMDAAETLAAFMRDEAPDRALFEEHVLAVMLNASRSHSGARVRAYGEMVDVLWSRGNTAAAIQLEDWWNQVTNAHPIALLCGYSMGSFYHSIRPHRMEDICRRHGRVVTLESETMLDLKIGQKDEIPADAEPIESEQEQQRLLEQVLHEALVQKQKAEEALERNISRRMLAEVELHRAREEMERCNRKRAEFLAAMGRELSTPLNVIIGSEQLLTDGVVDRPTDRQRELLQRIRMSAHHLISVLEDVQYVSQIEAGSTTYEIADTVVADVIGQVAEMLEPEITESGLLFTTQFQDGLVVSADADKLKQILLSLIGNALKFTPAPGSISVTAVVEPSTGTMAEIRVADTGPGITPEARHLIFDRIAQLGTLPREKGGLGLGLTISRDLARGMNGDLALESHLGEGATFVLRLPRVARAQTKIPSDK